MVKPQLQHLIKDSPHAKYIPVFIKIPAPAGPQKNGLTKATIEASLDDLALAAYALERQKEALDKRLSALRALYAQARASGALGAENILAALSRGDARCQGETP